MDNGVTVNEFNQANDPTEAIEIDPEVPHRLDREMFMSDLGILVIDSGLKAGSRYVLDDLVTTIGREKNAGIFLDDITVSRRHAQIEKNGSDYVVADAGSLNGTYLNGQIIKSATFSDGDVLQIGRFKFVFFHGTN
tara:strand:- start:386 stop:793 length:408 start_codon:yes stop_codon:yes gene_type:complete